MHIELIRTSRRPSWPVWAMLVVLLWLGLGGLIIFLGSYFHHPVELCLFKRVTGLPCPTCGFTRGALSFLHGHIVQGWLYNPLLFSVLILFFAYNAIGFIFSRTVQIHLTYRERTIAWILAIMLLSINWMYVILFVK